MNTKVKNLYSVTKTVRVMNEIYAPNGELTARNSVPLTLLANETAAAVQRLVVSVPQRWNVETPDLYTCKTSLQSDEQLLDSEENVFGIRTLSLDSREGLKINGDSVKLRGACIHHDHGVIGARSFADADVRKIRKLKEAGFNAIRCAHHPASRSLLTACDRLGMLVMEETFDMWTVPKSTEDYSHDFMEWWERDLEAMIDKDYNHPSVIIYSIGNEIPDLETVHGARMGRLLAEKVRELDETRYTSNCVNGILYALDKMREQMMKLLQSEIQWVFLAERQDRQYWALC